MPSIVKCECGHQVETADLSEVAICPGCSAPIILSLMPEESVEEVGDWLEAQFVFKKRFQEVV